MNDEEELLDGETCLRLKKLVEIMTHSGLKILDESLFKEIKKICRLSPGATEKTYSLILYQLKKNHSEIRHLAFQMIVELFKRSALFRELVVKELQLIYELSAGTNPKKKLPPPKSAAVMLERLALSAIKKWNDEFGDTFKEIKIAYSYLKHSKKVNFDVMISNDGINMERQRQESAKKAEKMESLIQDINNHEPEMESTLTSLTNCLSLLVPSPDNFFINDIKEDTPTADTTPTVTTSEDEGENINLKHFGITSNYGISIEPGCSKIEVKKTDENCSIIQNAEDNVKLIKNRFLPMLKKWNQICVKYSTDNGATIQRILKLKNNLENVVNKFKELNIQNVCDNSESSSDEFEEVTKEYYESSVQETENFEIVNPPPVSQKKLETSWKISLGEDGDPASALSTLKAVHQKESRNPDDSSSSKDCDSNSKASATAGTSREISRKEKLLASAPKLPFDIDLYHWEDQNLTTPTLLSIKMDNPRFWGASSVDDMDEIPNPDGVAALRTRVIEFSGKFEPVKWSCRAPLPNGKLCPRKDRFRCPFHGKIVARNEDGVPRDGANTSEKRKAESDWQDPGLLEDIKNATGVDLTMPQKKRRSAKKLVNKTHKIMKTSSSTIQEIEKRKFPGLTDTIGKQENAYKRLSKKIFKRGALNKVAATLDKIDFVKHRDKFGDQFNYVYGT